MAKKKARKGPAKKPDAQKVAAKRERRAERQRQEAAARARAARQARIRKAAYAGAGFVALVLVALFVYSAVKPGGEVDGVERPPDQGREHLQPGQSGNYDSATPTSGAHALASARCGFITDALPLEFAVHALEHGAVVVWYRSDLETALTPDLRDLLGEWDSHVIVAANPGIDDPIVATAWNRLKRFDSIGDDLIEFIDTYRKRGPESVPCDI